MTPGEIRDLLAVHVPRYRVDTVVQLAEGLGNLAYLVNDEMIVRISKEPDPSLRSRLVWREASLLGALRTVSTLPTPDPVFVAADSGAFGYCAVPGTSLLTHSDPVGFAHSTGLGELLGAFLSAIHQATQLCEWVEPDDAPMLDWRDQAVDDYVTVRGLVPGALRPGIEAFLSAAPPPGPTELTFCHNDLGIEHILVDAAAGRVTGVIDWTDAAINDPACDFALVHRDLGVETMEAALSRYEPVPDNIDALRTRALFYARCAAIEDLVYGSELELPVYTDNGLAGLHRLFSV